MQDGSWHEISDGVFARSHESLSLNVGLVVGAEGLLVFDTRESPGRGRELLASIRSMSELPVLAVVNSHFHWDHLFGNPAFPAGIVWAHPRVNEFLATKMDQALASALRWIPELEPELNDLEIAAPDRAVDPEATIDLGGRRVFLTYLGRAHTDSDIVALVEGSGVVFGGDIIESSAPPQFGDAFPHEWPATLALLMDLTWDVAIPGHGPRMDRAQVGRQAEELGAVSEVCRAVATGTADPVNPGGPYPAATMATAIARAVAGT